MNLSDFILSNIDSILKEWDEFARTMEPAAGLMSSKELRNHAAQMLRSVASQLREPQTGAESVERSHGIGTASRSHVGEEHGLARLNSQFSIEQLVSEYRALRSSVLRLWMKAHMPVLADTDDIIRFNE